MNEIKAIALPATLAVLGARASSMFGVSGTIGQLVASIVGAGVGLYVAKRIG